VETITITVGDERLSRLKEIASDYKVTVEELVRLSIDNLLLQPEPVLERAMEYILEKNRELYRRLA
jgi:hypothetical protein